MKMGWVLSKFRKSKSTMEVLTNLESDINNIIQFKASTAQTQKKVVGHLVTYSIVIYLLVAIFAYFKLFPAARSTQDKLLLIMPFLISPFLIWGLRRLLTWWYHRKIINNEKKLELLKQRKLKILDEVMEKETYKVAKEILDRFGDKSQGVGGRGPLPGLSAVFKQGPGSDNQLRRRTPGEPLKPGPGLNTSLPVSSSGPGPNKLGPSKLNSSMSVTNTLATRSGPGPASALTGPTGPQGPQAGGPGGPPRPPPGGPGGGRPGPPLPRPILPRERGYLDKFVEFLVGDGPANRYALICRQCESHNGMALREEFEYIAFRCCYCYYWNPARKQRPVAPRLTPAAERPIPATNSSDSSGSDVSAPNSVPGSRRGSVGSISKIENKESPVEETAIEKETPDDEAVTEKVLPVDEEKVSEKGDFEMIEKVETEFKEESNDINNTESIPTLLTNDHTNIDEIKSNSDGEAINKDNSENLMDTD